MIQCPLCSRSFAQEVVEFHAATCEGRAPSPPVSYTEPEIDDIQILEGLSDNSTPQNPSLDSFVVIGDNKHLSDPVARKRKGGTRSSGESNGENNNVSSVKYSPGPTLSGIECPICNERYSQSVIEEHAASCGDEVYV